MLKFKCPISGIYYNPCELVKNGRKVINAPHPLIYAPLRDLAELEPSSQGDYQIIFAAIYFKLSKLELIELGGAVPQLPYYWMKQELPYLLSFATWAELNETNGKLQLLPQFRMADELVDHIAIQNWRQVCQQEASRWDTYHDAAIARKIKQMRQEAMDLLDKSIHSLQTASKARPVKLTRAQSRQNFVFNNLTVHFEPWRVAYYCKIVGASHMYEVGQIQEAKGVMLDYLPESTIEDWNDKQEIVRMLDTTIAEKVGLARALGLAVPKQDSEIMQNIRTEHSVGQFITTPDQKLADAITAVQAKFMPVELPEVTSEPKREDYPNALAFMRAQIQWKHGIKGGK